MRDDHAALERRIRERTGGTVTLDQAKEALIRLLAGRGELWYDYFQPRLEQREAVAGLDWFEFLEQVEAVLDGKPDEQLPSEHQHTLA